MSFSIAQCPACESTFQVTSRILESAGGKVRCGACLSIFTAPDNLLELDDELLAEDESVFVGSRPNEFFNPSTFLTRQSLQDALRESQESDQEQVAPEESDDTSEQFFERVEEVLNEDLQSGDEEEFLAAVEAGIDDGSEQESPEFMEASESVDEASTGVEDTNPEQMLEADEELTAEDEDSEHFERPENQTDVSDAESEHTAASSHSPYSPYSPYSASHPHEQEDEQSPEAFRLHASFSVNTSPYSSAQQDDQPDTTRSDTVPPSEEEAESETLASSEAAKSSDAKQEVLIDWTEVIEGIGLLEMKGTSEAPEQTESTEAEVEQEDHGEQEDELDQSVEAIRARALQAKLEDEEALEAIPSENLQALGKFSTPVEIIAGQPRSLHRQLSWAALSLVAGLLLAAQYLWQEMDRYSQNSSLRPLYETTCDWLDCELPVYTDIEAIRASNLAVRSHPEVDNALTVNIEFQNFAPFAQQFPILVLSFNAANNSIIALREFAASEYLPEQLRGRQLMPSQTPLQIDLSIIDPGDDAVNYTLAFRNP